MFPPSVPLRELGKGGPKVPAVGWGAMGMTSYYGDLASEDVNREITKLAIELGCGFIDTSDTYGPPMGTNERLLGTVLNDSDLSKVFICTKFGVDQSVSPPKINGSPEYVRQQCEQSLKNLQVDVIDLYYQHRVDRTVPIEETWKAMAELQREGKVRYLGISEATADEIRRANAVAKVSALQIEFSPWTPDIRTNGILDVCRELGIAIVAYSPIGRGFLTGAIKSIDDLDPTDARRYMPRFADRLQENMKLVDALKAVAEKKGITAGQLCLAWVLAQGDDFIVIPGTKKEKYLRENAAARDVVLTTEEIAEVEDIIAKIKAVGDRYPAAYQSGLGF